ncbi:MAG TPA: 30S ribosomal protein S4 [Chroococcales cyanobacterium]
MARDTGPDCRRCRAEGIKLFLKGERCNTGKCGVVRRPYRPGMHGQSRVKLSEYAIRLREKQKARRFYEVLERQFEKYYSMASHQKGVTGERLLQILESRLDNVVFRLGIAANHSQARQFVRHGHILVNGKKVDIPSFLTKVGMQVSVATSSSEMVKNRIAAATAPRTPTWLTFDADHLTGEIKAIPSREEIDTPVKEALIVEYYSR